MNNYGYYLCIKCFKSYHKKCVLDGSSDELSQNGNLICQECRKKNYVIETVVEDFEGTENSNSVEPDDFSGERRLRQKKEVNYNSERIMDYSEESNHSTTSTKKSTASIMKSSSNSSIESLSKFNYQPKAKYQTRSGRNSRSDEVDEECVPQRASTRLRNSKPKNYNVDEENMSDSE